MHGQVFLRESQGNIEKPCDLASCPPFAKYISFPSSSDVDSRPWDFQAEECALRAAVDRFNYRRCSFSFAAVYDILLIWMFQFRYLSHSAWIVRLAELA